MSEFCPKCYSPMEVTPDPGRLCDVCGWFGDKQETLAEPPKCEEFQPTLAAAQVLDLYRDACRKELIVEQVYDAGACTEADVAKVRRGVRSAAHAIVEMFTRLYRPPTTEAQE